MKKTLLIPYILLGALCLVACRKEDAFEPVKPDTPIKVEPKEDDNNRQLGRAYLSLTIDAEDLDVLRGMDFVQTDRPGRDGEVLPKLNLRAGSTEQLYLILVKEGDPASMHRQVLDFTVLSQDDERAAGKANRLHYSGYVSVPEGYQLSEGKWYAMAILNMDLYNTEDKASVTMGEEGALVAFGRRHRRPTSGQTSATTGDHALIRHQDGLLKSNTYNVGGLPYLSQWQELTPTTQLQGNNATPSYKIEGLQLKPQGLLLHYEVGVDVAEPMAIRRYGLASNALAFSGYYDLDTQHLYNKFSNRDNATGIGYPDWEEDALGTEGLNTYYSAEHQTLASLRDGERAFPWDLPTLSQTHIPMQGEKGYPQALNLPTSLSTTVVLPKAVEGWWHFWLTGRGYFSRRSLLFWGMPRKQKPQTPFTYLWAGVYSHKGENSSPFPQDFSPTERIGASVVQKLNSYRREVRNLQHEIRIKKQLGEDVQSLEQSLRDKNTQYQSAFDSYKADSTLYYGTYQPQFLTNTTIHSQAMLVLHQTKQTFEQAERQQRVHHIRTLLSSDLMFSELVYHEEHGQNYSMLELHNPTTKPLDLNQYALVRLSRSGSHYAYRRANGTTTERLGDCVAEQDFLELKKVLRPHIVVGTPYSNKGYNVNRGTFQGERWYTDLWAETEAEEKALLPEQTFVLGAGGYEGLKQSSTVKPAWWIDTEAKMQHFALGSGDALRAMAYHSSDVMKLNKGEGWALLKRYGNKWQLIDATAPVGAEGFGFAGSISDYEQKMNSLSGTYSLRRRDAVSFPFLPPYRTKKLTTDWSDDWVVTNGWSMHTLGSRLSERSRYDVADGRLQVFYPTWVKARSPLDEHYSTYWLNRPHRAMGEIAFPPHSTAKPRPSTPPPTASTPPNPSNNGSNEPAPESYSATARAGQTWWVKGVNASAPQVNDWKPITPKTNNLGLRWEKSYGWYDLNKEIPYAGSGSTDSDLCWAAVSANALQWWLDQNKHYIDRYNYTGPRTFTNSYTSDIFDLYKRHFQNKGGDLKASMDWFFNGKYVQRDLEGAGFFVKVFGADFKPVEQIGIYASSFSNDVAKALKSGEVLGAALKYPKGYLHAISIWGATFDSQGQITHIYLTDSNDKDLEEQSDNQYQTKAGLLRKAIQLQGNKVYHESSTSGVFNFELTYLFKLGLHQDKWEAYFAKQAR